MTTQPIPKEMLPDTLWQDAEELLEAPFLLATEWWLTAAEAIARAPTSLEHPDHYHQLVVPEPFDAASESGLFA